MCLGVGSDVEHGTAAIVGDGFVHADAEPRNTPGFTYFLRTDIENLCHFQVGRLTLVLLGENVDEVVDFLLGGNLIERQPDYTSRGGNGVEYGLANPPHGEADELEATGFVELVQGRHHADVALVDEVGQVESHILETLGHAHHKPQVGLDDPLPCLLIALVHTPDRFHLFVDGHPRILGHLREIFVDRQGRPVCDA